MSHKVLLSLVAMFVCQSIVSMDNAIRVDSSENNQIVVNFLIALSVDKSVNQHIKDVIEWRKERINAYKQEYCISGSDCIVEDAYRKKYIETYGSSDNDHSFEGRSTVEIIQPGCKYEIRCSCQYEGHPEWKMRAFSGYSEVELDEMAEQVRDQRDIKS